MSWMRSEESGLARMTHEIRDGDPRQELRGGSPRFSKSPARNRKLIAARGGSLFTLFMNHSGWRRLKRACTQKANCHDNSNASRPVNSSSRATKTSDRSQPTQPYHSSR